MQLLKFLPIPTGYVRSIQRGELDSNGQTPERHSKGGGPCRHCLQPINSDEEMLVIGYCPFPTPQPYAETGPIFLHARNCASYKDTNNLPHMFKKNSNSLMIVRGYGSDDRIQYDATAVIPVSELEIQCKKLLLNPEVIYLHVRFAATNCYQFRVERGS